MSTSARGKSGKRCSQAVAMTADNCASYIQYEMCITTEQQKNLFGHMLGYAITFAMQTRRCICVHLRIITFVTIITPSHEKRRNVAYIPIYSIKIAVRIFRLVRSWDPAIYSCWSSSSIFVWIFRAKTVSREFTQYSKREHLLLKERKIRPCSIWRITFHWNRRFVLL